MISSLRIRTLLKIKLLSLTGNNKPDHAGVYISIDETKRKHKKTMEAQKMFQGVLPYFGEGEVVKGFGRGSKELGCPTANFPREVVDKLPSELDSGVYYGFANVEDGPVYKMVMCIGWNPYYNNTVKSMETHILNKFDEDFYGKHMKVAILGYLRPQKNFNSLDELISAINNDIDQANKMLDNAEYSNYVSHEFFRKK